ncbi:heat shock protein HspQ [Temperatibacter marinus]|uniref:Heat shock protein HspQ n=1 Tax=Temperatibacter marinus TaxID=1456591 RepID=A0AA52HAB9_9PROT|nr:heat shock protein HspQ [Temperatibacter marinus]WND02438.1 heat shock protein HspQ [Temperatibacter marinus]
MQQNIIVTDKALFSIGQIVKHRLFDFRGVIVDVDPEFDNTEEWWLSIPEEIRPVKEQPFYHLLAENEDSSYEAYVSQQNLLADTTDEPIYHPEVSTLFGVLEQGKYELKGIAAH